MVLGSRFFFDLPLEPTMNSPVRAGVSVTVLRTYPGAKILIAEDNAVNQKLLIRMLERRGCEVDVAGNGVEAVALASQKNFHLILMDCQMPEMDGFEATRQILEVLGGRVPAIVAVTARAMEEDRRECLSAGMSDCIVKPISASAIDAVLEHWLKSVEQSLEPAATTT